MATVVIPTACLELVLQTPEEVLAWVASLPPADRAEVSAEWIARVRSTPAGDPWALSYTARLLMRRREREGRITAVDWFTAQPEERLQPASTCPYLRTAL
jgi:hypothetical protein